MIDLYFWTTPNGYKPLLFLEETGIRHRIVPINISKGEQFDPAFLTISPNNRIPASATLSAHRAPVLNVACWVASRGCICARWTRS